MCTVIVKKRSEIFTCRSDTQGTTAQEPDWQRRIPPSIVQRATLIKAEYRPNDNL